MLFIALQDLKPLYAGRCEYHSSETASERDVRDTYFTFCSHSEFTLSACVWPELSVSTAISCLAAKL